MFMVSNCPCFARYVGYASIFIVPIPEEFVGSAWKFRKTRSSGVPVDDVKVPDEVGITCGILNLTS